MPGVFTVHYKIIMFTVIHYHYELSKSIMLNTTFFIMLIHHLFFLEKANEAEKVKGINDTVT